MGQATLCSKKQRKSSQWKLYKVIKQILPLDVEIIEDYVHPFLKFPHSGRPITFDIYAPSLKLVFEYNGCQHYHAHIMFGDGFYNKKRDDEKNNACKSTGITFIEIPYWWKSDKESIVVALHTNRPDLLPLEG